MRILIIDDEPLTLRATVRALAAAGHRVHGAKDFNHAGYLLVHADPKYDAIVTDHDLVGTRSGTSDAWGRRHLLGGPAIVITFTGNPADARRDAPEGALIVKKPDIQRVIALLSEAAP